tara:strand:- start:640 stop:1326 length:687 start_codon:yes stop_codon:yes gene_type:complete
VADSITLKEVKFRWHKAKPWVLDILHFQVGVGQKVFIAGPSGSGKTTLLNLISGIILPDEGRIWIEGTDLVDLGPAARDNFRGEHIGYVFQSFNLIPYLSIMENVLLPCRFSRERMDRIPGDVTAEANRLLDRMEINTASILTARVSDLSIGQQQRVAAARALLGAPQLIIADEPTSALDTENRDAFIELLFAEANASKATLLFVSHDIGLASAFDHSVSLPDVNRAN